MYYLQEKISIVFKNLFENFSAKGEGRKRKWYLKLRAQVLKVAASRDGPLEGAYYLEGDPTFYEGG